MYSRHQTLRYLDKCVTRIDQTVAAWSHSVLKKNCNKWNNSLISRRITSICLVKKLGWKQIILVGKTNKGTTREVLPCLFFWEQNTYIQNYYSFIKKHVWLFNAFSIHLCFSEFVIKFYNQTWKIPLFQRWVIRSNRIQAIKGANGNNTLQIIFYFHKLHICRLTFWPWKQIYSHDILEPSPEGIFSNDFNKPLFSPWQLCNLFASQSIRHSSSILRDVWLQFPNQK